MTNRRLMMVLVASWPLVGCSRPAPAPVVVVTPPSAEVAPEVVPPPPVVPPAPTMVVLPNDAGGAVVKEFLAPRSLTESGASTPPQPVPARPMNLEMPLVSATAQLPSVTPMTPAAMGPRGVRPRQTPEPLPALEPGLVDYSLSARTIELQQLPAGDDPLAVPKLPPIAQPIPKRIALADPSADLTTLRVMLAPLVPPMVTRTARLLDGLDAKPVRPRLQFQMADNVAGKPVE